MPKMAFDPSNVLRKTVEIEFLQIPVPSTSRDITHYVSLSASCSCESYRFRSKCRHIGDVLSGLIREDGVFEVGDTTNNQVIQTATKA